MLILLIYERYPNCSVTLFISSLVLIRVNHNSILESLTPFFSNFFILIVLSLLVNPQVIFFVSCQYVKKVYRYPDHYSLQIAALYHLDDYPCNNCYFMFYLVHQLLLQV